MLDIKRVRANLAEVKEKLAHRNEELGTFENFEEWDQKRRDLIAKTEDLKAERNKATEVIAVKKRAKEDAQDDILKMRE